VIIVLTNVETELLCLRAIVDGLPEAFPAVRAANPDTLDGILDVSDATAVIVRLLGGRAAWREPFDTLRASCVEHGVPLVALSGEAVPDAELTALSTVPAGLVTTAFAYAVAGGPTNLEHLLRFVADTVGMHGFGFEPPVEVPAVGVHRDVRDPLAPTVGVLFYRAHLLAGNTVFVDALCDAIEARGANAVAVWCYSLRPGDDGRSEALDLLAERDVDAIVTTMLAMGSADGEEWAVPQLVELDVPIVQSPSSSTPAAIWESSDAGLVPLDVASGIAIPELDGRIIAPPFSFKEVVDDGDGLGGAVVANRPHPDRTQRVAGIVTRLAWLRHVPPAERRIAVVLSAYPTKRSRIGNAVGLDTPASVINVLHALRDAGYRVDRIPADGDTLMHELATGLTYDVESLTDAQLAAAPGRLDAATYTAWFESLPDDARSLVTTAWGDAPGTVHRDGNDLVFAGIDLGNVVVAIQPPRGFGEDPIAVYHSPDLAPTHHYLGFYRWLDDVWGADAIVHVGKHGTLEWLPGKGVGLSASCFPDAALGDVPFVYPFVVNDPGEGTQAKRRGHATIIDHLVPPMTTADTYDDLARLETLLDEYSRIQTLDPSKLPAIRTQVWELLVDAELHRDLGVDAAPGEDAFDELILHVDGYLCELKDALIRGGLHVLGEPPIGEAERDLVAAITRLPQGDLPAFDDLDLVAKVQADGWQYDGEDPTLRWVTHQLVPNLRRTTGEITNLLHALDGGYVAAGPSGAPTRGMAHVLPTGRNFFSVDPRAIPSPLAWEVGRTLADRLVERHLDEEGDYPSTVGLVIWGTAAMRTAGDDVAEALALLGVRPVWATESRRVTGVELIPDDELGRPRIDVTLRISGFFRDAFPHVVELLDDAIALAGFAVDGDPRVFGPKPGNYGSGILPLLESRDWRTDDDLAAVYLAWGGWAYGRGRAGEAAPDAMRRRFAAIDVAVKNQDNREHDIFDSDDYLQDHGGMVATVRALTGRNPKAWFGDSSNPANPKVRSLAEEAARVVRTRVVNPKWIAAMQRHGYKGAFEMAATVDYLFGYDATAQVVEDWMYRKVTDAYVADPANRKFFEQSNPWALRSIAERLLEAVDRGMWDADQADLDTLRSALLEAEGWEERR